MSYQNILVPVDDSPISYAAVEHALSLAKLSGAKVTILSVVAVDPFVGVDFYQVAPAITDYFMQAESHAKTQLQDISQSLSETVFKSIPRFITVQQAKELFLLPMKWVLI
jgi:nucleotide-binding universal stress UspA family protein